jgi:NitT/TauT family transport system substrate-binding protein
MHTIDLAYVGLGIHEELVAYVADQQDYYADEGVHVAFRDGCSWDIERLRQGAMVGLGRALVSRFRDGTPWVVLCVNTDRPLFWLLARDTYRSVADLRGRKIAMHPPTSPPGCFARIILRRHGLDPDQDVDAMARAPGDYSMDLRRLRDGSVDAAFVGSTLLPEVTAEEEGLRVLAFVGDEFQIPTTGIAVDPTQVPLDSPALRGLVRANLRALRTVCQDPAVAVQHISALIPRLDEAQASRYYKRYVAPYFKADGQYAPAVVENALPIVANELGIADIPSAHEIYRTELAATWDGH